MFFENINTPVFLAPLAGITDLPFRIICREYGADMCCTEMISAKALRFGDKKTRQLLKTDGETAPRAVQLFGSEPSVMASAAKEVEGDFDVIDINMGCPAPKIVKNGEGSALMKNPALAGKIIEAVVNAVKLPVTVKMRRGFESESCVKLSKIAEECGAAAITVHGRYATQMYSGRSSLEAIAKTVEAVKIPVIGNGDIFSAHAAVKMLKETGCRGICVARGSLGNPFIFREIKEYLASENVTTKTTTEEKLNTAMRHAEMLVCEKGGKIGILNARKHMAWYVKGMRGAAEYKKRFYAANTLDEIKQILQEVKLYGNYEADRSKTE
ncbi:MAG: tRNA dihydrouridine synthase DusB [Clostridia bacterium]|nr:tRNA dihydrouridine synthase DusB [Clostridia bacterium]